MHSGHRWFMAVQMGVLGAISSCSGDGGETPLSADAPSAAPPVIAWRDPAQQQRPHSDNRITLQGLASSPVGISRVEIQRPDSAQNSIAQGLDSWQAELELTPGDNAFRVLAYDTHHQFTAQSVSLYYHPQNRFTHGLELSPGQLSLGQRQTLSAHIQHSDHEADLWLWQSDGHGQLQQRLTPLRDDGFLGDIQAGDRRYTAQWFTHPTSLTPLCFRVQQIHTNDVATLSDERCLNVRQPATTLDIEQARELANRAQTWLEQAPGQALSRLRAEPTVAYAASSARGDLGWISHAGLLGYARAVDTLVAPTSGAVSAYQLPRSEPAWPGAPIGSARAATLSSLYQPLAERGLAHWDEAQTLWLNLQQRQSCALYADQQSGLPGAPTALKLDDYRQLDQGWIHISAPSLPLYDTLAAHWQAAWGDAGFLPAQGPTVLLQSGAFLPSALSTLETRLVHDLLAQRLAIGPQGELGILPHFFRHYLSPLPDSVVVLSMDHSAQSEWTHAFLSAGASAVLGFETRVQRPQAQDFLRDWVGYVYQGQTLAKALQNANTALGGNRVRLLGDGRTQLRLNGFEELDFEQPLSRVWHGAGHALVIPQLGPVMPTSGQGMGLVYTSALPEQHQLSQQACLPGNVRELQFDWQFLSEAFNACQAPPALHLQVDLCDAGVSGQAPTPHCAAVFQHSVASLCEQTQEAALRFNQLPVHTTGWRRISLPAAAFANRQTQLRFRLIDQSDTRYNSALLLDRLQWAP